MAKAKGKRPPRTTKACEREWAHRPGSFCKTCGKVPS